MSSIIKNKNKGFTLAELLIVITIISVLIAFIIPVIANKIENSREAADIANVRSAYAEVMSNVITENDADASRIVKLKQKKDDWQREFLLQTENARFLMIKLTGYDFIGRIPVVMKVVAEAQTPLRI